MWTNAVITASWVVFLVVWIGTAVVARPKAGTFRRAGDRGAGVRLLIAVLVLAVLQLHPAQTSQPLALQRIGAVLAAAGIAIAVWARFYLGRNWGMPMSQVESPDLVTSGPYKWVRHPIYSGVLLAMVGTMLAVSWWLVVPLSGLGWYFTYSAVQEEKRMRSEFGPRYDAYKRRSKMLVPWLL